MKLSRTLAGVVLALLLLAFPVGLFGQATIPVSGVHVTNNVDQPLTGNLIFTVTDTSNTPVTYTPQGGSPTTATISVPVSQGRIQNVGGQPPQIPNPLTMSPSNTRYRIQGVLTGGSPVYYTLPLTNITTSSWSFDGYAVAPQVTATGIGRPQIACTPGALYTQTDLSLPYPWVCSQMRNDNTVNWTQNPSLPPNQCQVSGQAFVSTIGQPQPFCVDSTTAWATQGMILGIPGSVAGPWTAIPSSTGTLSPVAPVAHQFFNGVNSSGFFLTAQPAFTDLSGSLLASQLPAFTGDATSTAGTSLLTFATVNSNVGACGDSTHVGRITLNAKGLATACTPVAISGAGGGAVSSVFTRTGAVTAQTGDYSFSQISGSPSASQVAGAGTLTNSTSGNAGTATQFAATPTQCPMGQVATGITANGTPNCTSSSANVFASTHGIVYNTGTNTSMNAIASQIVALWSGAGPAPCTGGNLLQADGQCVSPSGGAGIPVTPTNALVKINGSNGAASAVSDDGTTVTSTEEVSAPAFLAGVPSTAAKAAIPTGAHGDACDESSTVGVPAAGVDYRRCDSVTHTYVCSFNGAAEGPCGGGGGSSVAPIGAVQIAAAAGAFAAGFGDTNYESPNSAPLGGNQGGIQDIARADVSGNQFQFSDGTLGLCAGVAYCTPTKQAFAEDITYTVLMNPSLFTASQVLNFATKFAAAVDAHGVMSAAIDSTGAISLVCSGFDLNCVYTSGPGASMVGLLCYVHYLKTGTVTCYTNNVAALKTSQAYRPINGSSHLPTVVLGANEYVPQSLFLEQARFSGDVANASVLLAAYDAAMLKMATAAGDATNVTFFTTNLSQVTASIQSEFVDGTSHMLFGATGQDAQIDILTSGMAVWFSQYLNSPILTLAQQKAIGTYLHTNLATIAHNGYFINSASSGGAVASWTSQGQIPSGGGAYTNICGSTTTYQNGYWSLVTGMAAQAIYLTNPSDVPTLLANFRDSLSSGGGDPAQEYYTQAFGTASGGTCGTASTYNMESPQSAAWAAANLVGPTPVAFGQGGTDKYGAIVTNPPSGALANPYTIASGPQGFKTTVSADGVIYYENDSVSGYTSNVFKDNTGTARLSIGWGNASSANLNNIDFFFGVGNSICIVSTFPGCAEFIDASNNIYFNTTTSTSAGGATAKLATNGALTLDSVTTTGGSTPWAATPFAGSMDANNGTADGGPWRGYYAANHNLAFNVSNLGVPGNCSTAEIIRFVKDDGESGGAVIGGIDANGNLCGFNSVKATVAASQFAASTTIGAKQVCLADGTNCPAGGGSTTVASAEVVSFSATPTFSTAFNVSRIVLTGNVTSFTLAAGADGQDKKLCFAQDGTGSRTVAGPANVHGLFTVGSTASKWNCQSFVYDNTDSIWLSTSTGTINQ